MIAKITQVLDLFPPTRFIIDLLYYLKRKITVSEVTEEILTNIEWIEEMNIPVSWFTKEKPLWISGVARLKNGDDFLEKVIESHLPFLDELILVDNMSTDKTKEICLSLKKKYPQKIKFFEYKYDVFPPWTEEKIETNSLHSLAYYYNWCFSKTKYSHVMKVDDDNLLIPERFKKIREKSLKSEHYNIYWWYNIIKDRKWQLWIPSKYKYSWRYWDHGIYKPSEKTYYTQWENFEIFANSLFYIRHWFTFFHLKFLKKWQGFTNLSESNYTKEYKNKINTLIAIDLVKRSGQSAKNYLYNTLWNEFSKKNN